MAAFSYVAINADGAELKGELSAPDLVSARELLRQRGLVAELLREKRSEGPESVRSGLKPVKPAALQIFSRQFATMIEAGIPVASALVILEQETADRQLASVVREVRLDVEGGMLLSHALGRHPRVFDRLYVAMVEAGEATGALHDVLGPVATHIERETKIRRRVRGAMTYPIVVVVFALCVVVALLAFLVPMFQRQYAELGGTLPGPTQTVISVSQALRHDWFLVLPAIVLLAFGMRRWLRSPGGREAWDRVKLRLPARIGDIALKVAVSHFARTLATLTSAGVDIVRALEITAQTVDNSVVERSLEEVCRRVCAGVSLGVPLAADPVFPAMLSQMVKIGDESGELDTMLAKVADFYEDEVDSTVKSLTAAIEPLMIAGVGVLIGAVLLSMYLPMFKLLTLVH